MTARKGDWVRIRAVILEAKDRTGSLPEDTRSQDIRMWTKGFLKNDSAALGDEVEVLTIIGRSQRGILTEVAPHYQLDYGRFLPELLYIGVEARQELKKSKEEVNHEG